MVKKATVRKSTTDQATVADVVRVLEHIEWYCRQARLMLRQLDKKTPIKLSRELKAMMKAAPPLPQGAGC